MTTAIANVGTARDTGSNYYDSLNTATNPTLNDPQLMLKMLAISMQHQDPMNPTDSSEFMNQMTQYATIESLSAVQTGMSNMVKSLESISGLLMSSNLYTILNNAQSLVGKEVDVLIPKGTNGSLEDETVNGVVEKVEVDENGIFLTINGKRHEYNNIKTIYS